MTKTMIRAALSTLIAALAMQTAQAAAAPGKPAPAKPAPAAKPDAAVHSAPPIPADPEALALARKVLGKPCHFRPTHVGPDVPGFTSLPPSVGQLSTRGGFVFIRQHGSQRVAFLAVDRSEEDQCSIADVQALPAKAPKEAFLDCRVDDPNPKAIPPLSEGLGLRQNGVKTPVAYLEVDVRHGKLIPRPGDAPKVRCSEFETGD